jgi:hypothetical protein
MLRDDVSSFLPVVRAEKKTLTALLQYKSSACSLGSILMHQRSIEEDDALLKHLYISKPSICDVFSSL